MFCYESPTSTCLCTTLSYNRTLVLLRGLLHNACPALQWDIVLLRNHDTMPQNAYNTMLIFHRGSQNTHSARQQLIVSVSQNTIHETQALRLASQNTCYAARKFNSASQNMRAVKEAEVVFVSQNTLYASQC